MTANFATVDAANAFARHAKAARPTHKHEVGGTDAEVNVISRKRLPPNIERRGKAVHTVCDVLKGELTSGEEVCQHHEADDGELNRVSRPACRDGRTPSTCHGLVARRRVLSQACEGGAA